MIKLPLLRLVVVLQTQDLALLVTRCVDRWFGLPRGLIRPLWKFWTGLLGCSILVVISGFPNLNGTVDGVVRELLWLAF